MTPFFELPAWDNQKKLRVVVETPKGSAFKLHFDAATGAFTLQRHLPDHLLYPYDWGFIPGTLADDGDPLDAMVMHDAATSPGVVIPCVPIAVLRLADRKPDQAEERHNHRIIAVPADEPTAGHFLSGPQKLALEEFFQAVGRQTKEVRLLGWGGESEARAEIERAIAAAARCEPAALRG